MIFHPKHTFKHMFKILKPLDELHKKHVLMKRIVMVSWKNVAVSSSSRVIRSYNLLSGTEHL